MPPALPSLEFQPKFYHGGVSRFHLPLLYDLVAARRPRQVVVLGFGDGQMSGAIWQTAREKQFACRCLTIRRPMAGENAEDDEAWQKAAGEADEFFSDVAVLRAQAPIEAASEYAEGSVDLLLIDDADSAEALREELRAWQPKLTKNAFVMVHGLGLERASPPRRVWEELRANRLAHEFEEGIGLGVVGPDQPELNEDGRLLYRAIVARIDAQHRAEVAARRNSALQLRQIWVDTVLKDRGKAQEIMDYQASELSARAEAFANLKRDRAKAQLIMDAQAEQLKQWVARCEKQSGENQKLKAKVAEQKRILNAAKKACRKQGGCFRLPSPGGKKERRSIPEKIIRELRRIPANLSRLKAKAPAEETATKSQPVVDRYAEWIAQHEPDAAGLAAQRTSATALETQPKISLLLPTHDSPAVFLEQLFASIAAQTYGNFEVCLVDGGSKEEATIASLRNWQKKETRLRVEFLEENLGIAGNTNRALALATGDFVACIDHDDLLPPFALYELARAIARHPEGEIFYSDEDRLSAEGKRHSPFFKPEWNPEYLLSSMYLGHLTTYRRDLVAGVGGFRREFDLAQDYDFALRATEQAQAIVHIPHVLYHWREHPGSGSSGGKPAARQANLAALAAAMERRGLPAEIMEYPTANRVRLKVSPWPKVSIVIPTDSAERGRFCVEQLPRMTSYPDYEVVIVTNSGLAGQLESIAPQRPAFRFVRFDEPFNFSAKSNLGAQAASGTRLIFFNDDVESTQPDWIENLIEPLENREIGAVAPKLLYESGRIQHAGMVTGVRGLAGTACHQWPADSTEYWNFAQSMRSASALSAACLAMRREDFFAVGEFDAVHTPIAHSDFDLSFKIRAAGLRCVYTPFVAMKHRGQASRGALAPPREKVSVFLLKRWAEFTCRDPYFPENMRDWLYADSPTPFRMWARDQKGPPESKADLLFVSHDLSWSGAPLLLFQLASWCQARGYFVAVMSPADGPLREKFFQAGIPLLVDPLIQKGHESFAQLAREFDFVIASTIFGAPIVRAAQAEGIPHLWWIHEGRVAEHYLASDAEMRAALKSADIILTPDTRTAQVYQPFTNRAIRVMPYAVADPKMDGQSLASARGERVKFLLLGTIEQRKGQQVLLKALRMLPQEVLAKTEFQIVGRAHEAELAEEIKAAVRACPSLSYQGGVTHEEALALIGQADVMLSAALDETGPLNLMEALALGRPILATAVGSVAENLPDEEAGLFFPPGDAQALAKGIERFVRDPALRARLQNNARAAYEKHFTFDRFAEGFVHMINAR